MQTKKEKRKGAQVSITGTLPKETIEEATEKTLLRMQREITLPGFRKGKALLGKVREYVGEKALWKESAESALRSHIETILKEHEVLPIMPVSAAINMEREGEDAAFEIVAVVAPTCSIDGYKETAERAVKKLEPLAVETEKEQALSALRAQSRQMTKSEGSGPLTDDDAKKLGFENAPAIELFL